MFDINKPLSHLECKHKWYNIRQTIFFNRIVSKKTMVYWYSKMVSIYILLRATLYRRSNSLIRKMKNFTLHYLMAKSE